MNDYCKTLDKEKSFDENQNIPEITPKQFLAQLTKSAKLVV